MKRLLLSLLLLSALPASAQTVALDYYTQCTGPAFEMQMRRQYDGLACQADESCAVYDPNEHAGEVEARCFARAVDICSIFDGSDRCIKELIDAFNERTSRVEAEYSIARAQDALLLAEGFTKRGLERMLQGDENGSPAQCFDRGMLRNLELSTGAREETICAVFRAISRSTQAYSLKRLILRVEDQP